jgi:hypothetical protein
MVDPAVPKLTLTVADILPFPARLVAPVQVASASPVTLASGWDPPEEAPASLLEVPAELEVPVAPPLVEVDVALEVDVEFEVGLELNVEFEVEVEVELDVVVEAALELDVELEVGLELDVKLEVDAEVDVEAGSPFVVPPFEPLADAPHPASVDRNEVTASFVVMRI